MYYFAYEMSPPCQEYLPIQFYLTVIKNNLNKNKNK